jgi:outer membrane immunogenic protein
MKGILGGAQAGYNWQAGTMVVGIETDLQTSKIGGGKTNTNLFRNDGTSLAPGSYSTMEQNLNWFGTFRARAGVLLSPSLLAYATGGLAFGNVSYSGIKLSVSSGSVYQASESKTQIGWALGGGAEWAVDRNWSLKAEYLYYNLGGVTMTADPIPANPPYRNQFHIETRGSIGRVGLNYKF